MSKSTAIQAGGGLDSTWPVEIEGELSIMLQRVALGSVGLYPGNEVKLRWFRKDPRSLSCSVVTLPFFSS